MTELEKAQAQIIELNDKLKNQETTISDLNQHLENFKQEKTNSEKRIEELQAMNKKYFDRIIAQDVVIPKGESNNDKNDNIDKGPTNWNDFVSDF